MRSRAKSRRNLLLFGGLVVVAAGGAFWYFNPFPRARAADAQTTPLALSRSQPELPMNTRLGGPARRAELPVSAEPHLAGTPQPAVPVSRPASLPAAASRPASAPASQQTPQQAPSASRPALMPLAAPATRPDATSLGRPRTEPPASAPLVGDPRVAAAQQKIVAGQLLDARQELNVCLRDGTLSGRAALEVRTLLASLADQTVFARKLTPGDPLQESYTIQPGDRLIHIARRLDLPHEILMEINKIPDAGTIRADQKIKLLRGPFHARIYKSEFRLDLYLGDLYVRSFAVGLGADPGTPEGTWKVKDRLPNPTYYPSASAPEKRIMAPDDPENPLGEHWIGLEGVDGDAVGHEGYGIHGTIEPESIGKAVSLGCIRMHNEDVAFVYQCLLPGKSIVTVLP